MAKTASATPEAQTTATCACGCGETVERTFKQGHDQVLISKLAQDLVHGNLWEGRCLSILSATDVKRMDIQDKINKVSNYVGAKLSTSLAAKFENAASRKWDLFVAQKERADAKEARKAEKAKPKARKAKAAATPSEEAGDATQAKPALSVVRPTASNDDIDRLEAEVATTPDAALGATVNVRVPSGRGTAVKEATVTGMNQAGKVTAIEYAGRGGKLVNRTNSEGFEIVTD